MSAILSESQLNDFITPGVACIKPIETLPVQEAPSNPYEVTTEDQLASSEPKPPPQISLTDCLACSGCVTSAEAVLVSLQSHEEVLSTLDAHHSLSIEEAQRGEEGRVFVASVSPQVRASLAATWGVSAREAGSMIEQILCGADGLRSSGARKSGFSWCVDTNSLRDVVQWGTAAEALRAKEQTGAQRPILASACPGWICYAEKTHPHVLPHLSRLKSPQALAGALVKTVLAKKMGIPPDRIWHLALMPCFDKKLEASREELTDAYWSSPSTTTSPPNLSERKSTRDVDCVITSRELLLLAETRGIVLPALPRHAVRTEPFPDAHLASFIAPRPGRRQLQPEAGPSGGYAYTVLRTLQRRHSGSSIRIQRGRNPDVVEYTLLAPNGDIVAKTARYYGFGNIQNLVRKLKPPKTSRLLGGRPTGAGAGRAAGAAGGGGSLNDTLYIEVMACPGGCTNGGGQVKVEDLSPASAPGTGESQTQRKVGLAEQKQWLGRVDEAYFSDSSSSSSTDLSGDEGSERMDVDHDGDNDDDDDEGNVEAFVARWTHVTGLDREQLLYTSFRAVQSDVGKKASDVERVAGLAGSVGGGW